VITRGRGKKGCGLNLKLPFMCNRMGYANAGKRAVSQPEVEGVLCREREKNAYHRIKRNLNTTKGGNGLKRRRG